MSETEKITDTYILSADKYSLQNKLEEPKEATGEHIAVICHPHPLEKGTMDNKVVDFVGRAFRECGIPTWRFNFRGVGQSEGSYDGGVGEVDDALAVVEHAKKRYPSAKIWLAGFSFGSHVALKVSHQVEHCAGLVLVAPPVGLPEYDFEGNAPVDVPVLLLQGEQDEVVDAKDVSTWSESLTGLPFFEYKEFAGVTHFFHGVLPTLKASIEAWVNIVENTND